MKANPGGQIDLGSVIGRDSLIALLWDTVEQQSVVMTAERRIGKTTIMKKMVAEPRPGWVPVFQDLERCHSAVEFAMAVYKEIHQFLGSKGKFARRSKEFFTSLAGAEIGGIFKLPDRAERHWKEMLTRAIEDLVVELGDVPGDRLLFFWDEMPFMLANIRDREGEQTAMEVLDALRALRQTHSGLRMVITGSVGLHHVLSSLKDKNYVNSPVNDMAQIDVPPLAMNDATLLAQQLIEGEALSCPDMEVACAAIASRADCFPFYIHHIVRALRIRGLAAQAAQVVDVVNSQLVDANDPWELCHYRERIPVYYGADQKSVLHLLDELALSDAAISLSDLLTRLKNLGEIDDRERLLKLLTLLQRDHYLNRDAKGCYSFRFPLIQRWWKINRGL